MPKSLGQIHTVNYTLTGGTTIGAGLNRWLIDLPGQLTEQLNHMVRMGSNFKVVGIDATLTDAESGEGGQSVNGLIRYYAPTRGRCLAVRDAYAAVRNGMKLKGIHPTNNLNYDFRPPINPPHLFQNGSDFKNQASIQYDFNLDVWKPLCVDNNPGFQTIFDTWNTGLEPRQGQIGNPDFSSGYDITLGGVYNAGAAHTQLVNDYVLQEGMYLQTHEHFANDEYEEIPFTLANSDGQSAALELMWRPDPALYLSVMLGQFDVLVEEVKDLIPGVFFEIDIAVHVSGWVGMMSDKKRRSKKSRRRSKKK